MGCQEFAVAPRNLYHAHGAAGAFPDRLLIIPIQVKELAGILLFCSHQDMVFSIIVQRRDGIAFFQGAHYFFFNFHNRTSFLYRDPPAGSMESCRCRRPAVPLPAVICV